MNQALQVIAAPLPDVWIRCRGRIYFIGCAETYRLKIGFTAGRTHARLRALQTGSPTRLVMLGCIPGTLQSEQKRHAQFAADRLHGEWFRVSPAVYDYLEFAAYFRNGSAPPETDPLLVFGRKALAYQQQDGGRK